MGWVYIDTSICGHKDRPKFGFEEKDSSIIGNVWKCDTCSRYFEVIKVHGYITSGGPSQKTWWNEWKEIEARAEFLV